MEMERFSITLEGLEIWREQKKWLRELIPSRFDMLVIDAGSMTKGLNNIISGYKYLGMRNLELNCPTVDWQSGGYGYYVESAEETIDLNKIVFEYFSSREKKLTSLNIIAQINILQSRKDINEGFKRGDHLYKMLEKLQLHKPIQNPLGLVTVNCTGASSQGVVMRLHEKINPRYRIPIVQIDEELNLAGMYSEYERRFHRLMIFLKRKDMIRIMYTFNLYKQPVIDPAVKEIIRFFIMVINVLKVDKNATPIGNEFSTFASENVVLIPGNVVTRYEADVINGIDWLIKKDLIYQLIKKGTITMIALLNDENYKHDLNKMVGGEIYGVHTQIVSFPSGLLALPLIKLPLEELEWFFEQLSDNHKKIVEDIRYRFHQVSSQKIKELQ